LLDGGYGGFQPGTVVFRAAPDYSTPNIVTGTQNCPDPGYLSPMQVRITIVVIDAGTFTEDLVDKGVCKGFPVKFVRTGPS